VLTAPAAAAAGSPRARARPAVVAVTVRDFRIGAPRALPAGRVTLRVHNRGPDDHELLVVRHRRGALPLRGDGLTVDEDRIAGATVAMLEPGAPYETRTLSVTLPPGRYDLFCNMSGHYLGGMHRRVTVR
jgi:uncharacterized cupredoxin-like copper-binding protein